MSLCLWLDILCIFFLIFLCCQCNWSYGCCIRTLNYCCCYTGWGKIPSILSVGHCERRGGRRRVWLGSKFAGSWEVPVTTLRSRKDGVVQRAARICRRNLLFAKSLYRSGAAGVPYSLPNPPSGPSTRPKIHSVVG